MLEHMFIWVEIPVADMKRAKAFYEHILQCEMQEMPMGDSDYAFFPVQEQFNGGALVQGTNHKPSTEGVTVYLYGAPDMDVILSRVQQAGGQILMGKTYMGKTVGYIGMFRDSEGNRIGVQHL
jgi:predicted enzyme related to lactoylglutathione lyase